MDHSGNDGRDDLVQQFLRDFGWYTVAKAVPGVLGAVALVIFTRVFPTAAYGRYALAMTFVALFSTFVFGWLKQAILRFEPELDSEELLENVISVLIISCLLVLVTMVVGYILFGGFLGEYQPFYFAVAALVVSQGVFSTFFALFRARLESRFITIFTAVRAILRLGFALVLAIVVLDHISGWLWGAVIGTSLCVAAMVYQSSYIRFSPRIKASLLPRFLRYGFPMIGWLLGLTLLNFADRILLEIIKGSSAVGVYSANYELARRGLILAFTPLTQAIHPLVMDAWDGTNRGEIRNLMTEFTRYFLIAGVAATVFAAVISRPLSTLLLDAQYHDGYLVIPLVAAGLFLWNISMVGHKGLEIEERTGLMFLGVGVGVLLNVALNVPLITLYGYFGAAVATLVSFGSYTVFAYIVSSRSIQWRLPTRTLRNTAVAGLIMATPAAVLYYSKTYTLLLIIGATGLGTVLYPVVLYVLDEFRPNEISAITGYIEKS